MDEKIKKMKSKEQKIESLESKQIGTTFQVENIINSMPDQIKYFLDNFYKK